VKRLPQGTGLAFYLSDHFLFAVGTIVTVTGWDLATCHVIQSPRRFSIFSALYLLMAGASLDFLSSPD
jgi:hypothetical protein